MAHVSGRMSWVELIQVLNKIVVDLTELRTEYNALRTNMLAHDHGATGSYVGASIRINASADSVTGTVTANAADALTHTTLGVPPA